MASDQKNTLGVGGTPTSASGTIQLIVLALFFLSGACGLVYEVVWMRMLTLVFGATAFATSTILASFFAGLALGGFSFGRLIDRGARPLFVYALLEAGIGAFAFLMPLLFSGLDDLYVLISQRFGVSFYQLSLFRFSLSFAVLLIPATLMGGTLPVIVKFFADRQEKLGFRIGQLYAMNTFGAVVGTLSAGFFLILWLGVREAAYLAGALNLLIAGAVFILDLRARRSGEGMKRAEPRPGVPVSAVSSRVARMALWAIGLSGFCALALEVLWTRALVFFLDNSTHAFTTILTAFLLGIALGSALIARFIDTRKRLLYWLGAVEVLIGIFAILAIPILSNSTPVIQTMARMNPADPMLPWKWMGMRFATTLAVMLLPTLLIGMTFPIVGKIYARTIDTVGTALGRVYAVNTLGGVFGSAVAGFALVPLLGVQASVIAVSALNTCIGIALILFDPATARRARIVTVTGSGGVFLVLGAFFLREGALDLTSYTERIDSAEVLSYEEGIGATVKVFRDHYGDKLLSINGFPVAGTPLGLHDAQKPLAHLPLLLSPVPSPKVNLIGFGAGGASWGVLQYDVERVDCVELVPAVPNAAEWFPEINHGVLSEPRFNLIMGDGRNYALVAEEKYDVISIDATSPKMAGNGALYSLEFYRLLKERLTEHGLAVQWIPFHLLSEAEVRMTTRTFIEVFPHTTLWLTALRQHAILVGTQEALEIDFTALREKIEDIRVQRDLESLKVTDAVDFLGWFVMGEAALERYAGDAPLNTDNHPYLEFTPAMAYFVADQYRVENLRDMRDSRESVLPLLTNLGATEEEGASVAERIERRFESTQHSLLGDMMLSLGRRDEAIVEYNLALVIDPDDKNWMNPIWRDVEIRR